MAYDPVSAAASRSGETASIGTTTLLTASTAGLYQIAYYFQPTVAGSAGTVLLTLGWHDGVTAQSAATAALSLSTVAAGTLSAGTRHVWLAAGQALTYATTVAAAVGSPQYALRLTVTRLG